MPDLFTRLEDGARLEDAPASEDGTRVPVLLPVALDQTYDYLAPPGVTAYPGAFVLVPFGPQMRIGIIWDGPLA